MPVPYSAPLPVFVWGCAQPPTTSAPAMIKISKELTILFIAISFFENKPFTPLSFLFSTCPAFRNGISPASSLRSQGVP
jgi:hypothetical protein